ncbi:excinuclease ABC subunit UvrC [Timonella senegalensis]|uniref:excinuclease ABC subunit UvrC n=1 Tax=Timonella senegalensis TaxID=1465825 RepID=UPI0002E0D3A4|nr:excinuclease ABC subunit UvrC [Timonella senegalensis]
MADPSTYRPKPGEIPTNPGVYRFRDHEGRVIYVGKAKNLRSRLSNYFQDLSALHPRTQTMVTTASAVEWTIVGTEVEALALEYTWIKEFEPRFNVKLKDDKSYPFLMVTMSEEVPRAQVMRGSKKAGNRYFGPFGHAWAIRETLDLLLRVFPIRTCSAGVYNRAKRSGRPCLLGYIDKCSAPCVERITLEKHRELAEDFCSFMEGDTGRFIRNIEDRMKAAAKDLDFETAARMRDDITALKRALEKNAVVLSDATDADIFGIYGDDLEAAVQVFHVRGGRIRGQRGWVVEKVEDISDEQLVDRLIQQVYAQEIPFEELTRDQQHERRNAVPREVLVPILPEDVEDATQWLTQLRGSAVSVRIPQRGEKAELAKTVLANAEQALKLHRTRRSSDLTSRSQALREIQEALDLDSAPLRIECYDVSHNQGTYQSASMVVFEDGMAKKNQYRVFNVRGPEGEGARDDTAAMYEVITRRFKRYLKDQDSASQEELILSSGEITEDDDATLARDPHRFAYAPSLVIVDGGQPQVAAAARALSDLGIDDVALCGLAKRLEEIWLPDDDYPVILRRSSEGLYLMQRLRDEAHRFAITAHRKRRSKGMIVSELDAIPGLGPAKAANLLKHFGSLKKLKAASIEEIAAVKGYALPSATKLHAQLHPGTPAGEA